MKERVEKILEGIRPAIQKDGGDIEFVGFEAETGTAKVRLIGACATCLMSKLTLKLGVEAMLTREIPEIRTVVSV